MTSSIRLDLTGDGMEALADCEPGEDVSADVTFTVKSNDGSVLTGEVTEVSLEDGEEGQEGQEGQGDQKGQEQDASEGDYQDEGDMPGMTGAPASPGRKPKTLVMIAMGGKPMKH